MAPVLFNNNKCLLDIVIPPAHTIYVTLQSTRERASLLQNCIIMYLHMIRQITILIISISCSMDTAIDREVDGDNVDWVTGRDGT